LINRLDRETSGLVLVAKNSATAREAGPSGQSTSSAKAVLRQSPMDGRMLTSFAVDQPLLRQGEKTASKIYLKQAIHPAGYPARTNFAVVQRFENRWGRFALINCQTDHR